MTHDTIAAHLFHTQFNYFLNQKNSLKKKFCFFVRQRVLKNYKSVLSQIWFWFWSASHGKGSCDGLGGTIERFAAKARFQNINNPAKLFMCINKNITVNTELFPLQEAESLQNRFKKAKRRHFHVPFIYSTTKRKSRTKYHIVSYYVDYWKYVLKNKHIHTRLIKLSVLPFTP